MSKKRGESGILDLSNRMITHKSIAPFFLNAIYGINHANSCWHWVSVTGKKNQRDREPGSGNWLYSKS